MKKTKEELTSLAKTQLAKLKSSVISLAVTGLDKVEKKLVAQADLSVKMPMRAVRHRMNIQQDENGNVKGWDFQPGEREVKDINISVSPQARKAKKYLALVRSVKAIVNDS